MTITGAQIIADARRYLGVPYLYGGTNPAIGLDCSGLIYVVCHDLGITSCPRTSEEQFDWGTPVSTAEAGALVFFTGAEQDPPPGHVGIVISNGQMINEPYTGASCRVDNYGTNGTGVNEFLGYRKIPDVVSSPTSSASTQLVSSSSGQSTVAGALAGAFAGGFIAFLIIGMLIIFAMFVLYKTFI